VSKKMNPRSARPVTLRIRVVKVTAGFDRLHGGIFTVCGGISFTLSVKDPEWAVFRLRSEKEEIKFRTPYGNASCVCQELDGRRRIDFSEKFSILVEGYWSPDAFGVKCVPTQIPVVKEVTKECEIAFMATRESATNTALAVADTLCEPGIYDDESCCPSLSRQESVRRRGPVDIALGWMLDPVSSLSGHYNRSSEESRVVYEPSLKGGQKIVWEPDLTAMKQPCSLTGLEPIIKSVCMSQNLDRMYF
jgi:hypothetical protein